MDIFKKINQIPHREIILLLFITTWGTFLRLYYLGADSLWIDEGFTITQANAISKNFLPILDSGQYVNKDLLLPYLLAIIKYFGGASVDAYRLVSVIFGILCIPLAYKIGKEILHKNVGLIFSFLVAFSYWEIAWSRQIRAYILLEFLVLVVFLLLIKYHQTQKKNILFLLLFFTALSIVTKISAALLLPSLLIYFLTQKKYKISAVLIFILLVSSIFGYYYFKNSFSFSLNNYLFYYLIGYLWLNLGAFFPMAILGAYWSIYHNKYQKSLHFFFLSFFLFNILFFSFFYYINQKRYLFILLPIIFFYTASFLYYLTKSKKTKTSAILFILIFIIIIDIFSVKSIQMTPRKNFILENYTPQPDFRSAYNFLQNSLKPGDFLISPYPYMDKIYLNHSSYSLAISYTNKQDNESITKDKKEYYSGTPEISSVGRINSLRENGDVYIILDTMAQSRANQKIVRYINDYFSSESISFKSFSGDILTIYHLPMIIK